MGADCQNKRDDGFTLIELSIVLVIIGLIVGGILVGQSLISAAGIRAQVTQIEKYNTAANTFREKYGYLPGDITAPAASQFGFAARGTLPGQGDGNGILQGNWNASSSGNAGEVSAVGELAMFWVDLSAAHLIDGGFNTASSAAVAFNLAAGTVPGVANYLPQAKIGRSNYIYIWSGGTNTTGYSGDGRNYFGISLINSINLGTPDGPEGLTVTEASAIDTKVDDGLPQSGGVTAIFINRAAANDQSQWAGTGGRTNIGAYSTATAGSSTTCFDNSSTASGTPGVTGAAQHYSVEMGNGAGVNCALSFRMQAGD